MILEFLDNILPLLTIIIAMLISVTSYISSKQRVWLCAVGFFTGNLLSSYFWAAYYIIMGESPVASDFLTNFGWNMSYMMMLLLVFYIKSKESRRYFNPLMLLPIPLNIWQLILYFDFGGIINSIYEVAVCTATACLSIQGILWYIRERKNGAKKPYIEFVSLLCMCAEFGMWTFSCFDGWLYNMYYPFSILCSICYLLLIWAIKKTYSTDTDDIQTGLGRKVQNIMKGSYVAFVLIGATGGIFLGSWIRDRLPLEDLEMIEESESSAYDILPIILFLTSVILSVFATIMIFIVYFEQKISENQKLREARQVAERSNAAKSEFLANMSHEIRTPINAVLGMNKMIMRESLKARDAIPENKESVRQLFADITGYSANIESAGNNLLSIINDILDFSKIEAGKIDITEREYLLSSVLNDVSNTVMLKAKDKGLEFHIDTDADLPDGLYGDEVRIRQVMINILNNAVKYTDKGSVTLSVFGGGKLRYERGGTLELIISVKDTGIGIKKEDIDKIFDKFERTDLKRNSTVEGTGLGLAITHYLLEMMGGSVSVDSEYGKGSVFTIRIPQQIASTDPIGNFREKFEKSIGKTQKTDNIFRAPKARILIVDDTRMNLIVAAGLIKDTEIITDTAESGAEALDMTLSEYYDLILMDQRMPGMDGTETLRRFREREAGSEKQTPVICLTADAISGAKEHYLSQGFNDYLSKPIDSDELKKCLMKYLPPEKIITGAGGNMPPQPAAHDTAGEESGTLYGALRAAGIDTNAGLGFCHNNDDLYRTMLSEYVKSSAEKTQKIQQNFDDKNWKDYSIFVHSLKSTSRTIGVSDVAELAAKLEKAADEGNTNFIYDRQGELIEKYRKAVSAMSSAGISAGASEHDNSDDDEIMEFFPEQS